MPRYKVVEEKQKKLLRGTVRARDLESILNREAQDGWVLDRILAGDAYAFLTGGKDVFFLVFRKDDEPPPA